MHLICLHIPMQSSLSVVIYAVVAVVIYAVVVEDRFLFHLPY